MADARTGRRPLALDIALAGLLLAAAIVTTAADAGGIEPFAMTGAVVVAASVALRTIAPFAMAVLAAAAVLLVPRADGVLWLLAAVLVIAFSTGLRLPIRRALLGLGMLLASAILVQSRTSSWLEAVVTPLVLVGGSGLVGLVLATFRRQGERLRTLTERLRLERVEQQRLAAEAERSRLSRDLHDILAHTLSTIVVQASAAATLLPDEAAARRPVTDAADAARSAMAEVRSLLALTRTAPPALLDDGDRPVEEAPDRWRTWGLAAGCAAVAAPLAVVARSPSGFPLWVFVATLVLAFLPLALLPLRPGAVATAVVLVAASTYPSDQQSAAGRAVAVVLLVGGPALAGLLVGGSRSRARRLRRLGTRLAEERGRSAALVGAAERARIARELQDVLAHTLSSVAVQAGAAQQLLPRDHPARTAVDAVHESARTALDEVRGLLAEEGGRAPVEPGPSIERVPALVALDRAVLVEEGEPGPVDSTTSLAAFRLVQEALTNARRHAPGHRPTVTLAWEPALLRIRVENDGRPGGIRGDGHGLIGMRERVRACEGHLDAGPRDDGTGWVVAAALPLQRVTV